MSVPVPSFSLLSEPWIPVRDLTTGTYRQVGLTEALTRAHELELVATGDASTPAGQEYAVLLRVLLAAYDAAAGPADRAEWAAAWTAPALDADRITTYLNRWAHRLDLYAPHRPAFQADGLTEYPRPHPFLNPVFLGGKTGRWFGGADVMDRPGPLPAAEAARYVLIRCAYDVSGIKAGIGGGRTYGAWLGPLGTPTHLTLTARTLKDELLLNLPPAPRAAGDMPVWERPDPLPLTPGASAPVPGRLAWWTWPARLLRLLPDEHGAVTAFAWHDGLRPSDGTSAAARSHDPLTAWAGPDHRLPPPGAGWTWYAGSALLGCSPVVEHAVRAAEDGILAPGLRVRVRVSSTAYNQHFTVMTDSPHAACTLGSAALLAVAGSRARLAAAAHFAASAPRAIARVCADHPDIVQCLNLYLPDLTTAWAQLVDGLEAGQADDALARWRARVTDAAVDLAHRQMRTRTRIPAHKARVAAEVEEQIRRYLAAIPPHALPLHQGGEKAEPAARPAPRRKPPVPRPRRATTAKRPKTAKRPLRAFGADFPSPYALSMDPRCVVSYPTILKRLREEPELTAEEAASIPPTRGRPAAPRA